LRLRSWHASQFNIAAPEASASISLSACRSSFVARLTSAFAPVDILPPAACDAFSQLLFIFLMQPRGGPLEAAAWFSPFIHSYTRLPSGTLFYLISVFVIIFIVIDIIIITAIISRSLRLCLVVLCVSM
jgi:hypothetical protein